MKFQIDKKTSNSLARSGTLTTDHGVIRTPIFMPVGTQGTVKGVQMSELNTLGAQIILGNTFHLYLRPGHELISQAGGLHRFISWDKPMLTDSGGYQVYSLRGIRKITEEGVKFQSPVDGSRHFFSPEYAVEVQRHLGADIIMAFDECTPFPCEYGYAKKSMHMTHRWLLRCQKYFEENDPTHPYGQILAPIVQGSTYPDLRVESAKFIADHSAEVNAIGGLSVGEPAEVMYEMTEVVCEHLPADKARYLMGVGTPDNILEAIDRGIDMFDCVLPTRNARHGLLYTAEGLINIRNSKWRNDISPIDEQLDCPTSNMHSKAYLRHLFMVKEALGLQIASIHNLTFYLWLVGEARRQIENDTFSDWKKMMVKNLQLRR